MSTGAQAPSAREHFQQGQLLDKPRERTALPAKLGKTSVIPMYPKTIVGPGNGFVAAYDGVINPYSGCSFGCDCAPRHAA